MISRTLISAALAASCSPQAVEPRSGKVAEAQKMQEVAQSDPVVQVVVPPSKPLAEWETWCETPITNNTPACESDAECGQDRTGRKSYCVRPQASKAERGEWKICMPRMLRRSQQRKQRKNLRKIVDDICPVGCSSDKLEKFLAIPAIRESTWNHTTDHHLKRDLEANYKSYERARKRGRYRDNPHFQEDYLRWSRGYGWYGANASNFTYAWDPNAPPEILCRRPESTEAFLRKLRSVWVRMPQVECADGEPMQPTWANLHRIVWQLGRFCVDEDTSNFYRRRFAKRAEREGLDPDEVVTLEMLGRPVERKDQEAWADKVRARFEPVF